MQKFLKAVTPIEITVMHHVIVLYSHCTSLFNGKRYKVKRLSAVSVCILTRQNTLVRSHQFLVPIRRANLKDRKDDSLQGAGVGALKQGPAGQRGRHALPAPPPTPAGCPRRPTASALPHWGLVSQRQLQKAPYPSWTPLGDKFCLLLRNKTVSFFILLKLSTQLQFLLLMKTLLAAPISVNPPLNEFTECVFTNTMCTLTCDASYTILWSSFIFFLQVHTVPWTRPAYTPVPQVTHFFKSTGKLWWSWQNPVKPWCGKSNEPGSQRPLLPVYHFYLRPVRSRPHYPTPRPHRHPLPTPTSPSEWRPSSPMVPYWKASPGWQGNCHLPAGALTLSK